MRGRVRIVSSCEKTAKITSKRTLGSQRTFLRYSIKSIVLILWEVSRTQSKVQCTPVKVHLPPPIYVLCTHNGSYMKGKLFCRTLWPYLGLRCQLPSSQPPWSAHIIHSITSALLFRPSWIFSYLSQCTWILIAAVNWDIPVFLIRTKTLPYGVNIDTYITQFGSLGILVTRMFDYLKTNFSVLSTKTESVHVYSK